MSDYPFTCRPISTWPKGEYTPSHERRSSPFKASYTATMRLLRNELAQLDARDVVLEIAVGEGDIRLDGQPYARARATHPGIVLSFASKHGPLRYATDRFTSWEDNLRAIALALESLRRVDRYGITKRGEQYAGWRAIEARGQSADDALSVLWKYADGTDAPIDPDIDVKHLVRVARSVTHPDRGGTTEDFLAVQHAAETLGIS